MYVYECECKSIYLLWIAVYVYVLGVRVYDTHTSRCQLIRRVQLCVCAMCVCVIHTHTGLEKTTEAPPSGVFGAELYEDRFYQIGPLESS